jgi:hypothetical protein
MHTKRKYYFILLGIILIILDGTFYYLQRFQVLSDIYYVFNDYKNSYESARKGLLYYSKKSQPSYFVDENALKKCMKRAGIAGANKQKLKSQGN